MRRAEIGHHHHIAGSYLLRYAQEASWREDNRRVSNGDQVQRVCMLAMKHKPSVDFCGYWQRHVAAWRAGSRCPWRIRKFSHKRTGAGRSCEIPT
jgi:hypothetical protein